MNVSQVGQVSGAACGCSVQVCLRPYDEQPDVDAKYSSKPPPEMVRPGVCVLSCSS
jgi:hypothetical protein